MSFIASNEILLRGVLTRQGRYLLFKNNARFNITKFGLFDENVPYGLINKSDPDFSNITNLTVPEPSTNENSINTACQLIRFSKDNLEVIAREQEQQFVPLNEYSIETQIQGTQILSLEHYKESICTISFATKNPFTNKFFLTNSYIIDCSDFFIKYGINFTFTPLNPSVNFNTDILKNYWFNTDTTTTDIFGNIVPVIIGIDNDHKPDNGVTVENILNVLNIPILTFSLSIDQKYLRNIFTYLLQSNVGKLEGNIIIKNNDTTYKPVTDFYGNNSNYTNIATKIPLTITF